MPEYLWPRGKNSDGVPPTATGNGTDPACARTQARASEGYSPTPYTRAARPGLEHTPGARGRTRLSRS
eukprot:8819142-Alexandrium_andersonii.AAC.1